MEKSWRKERMLTRTYLAMESRVTGERRDLLSPERRKVVMREAPANMDWATGTPMKSRPGPVQFKTHLATL